MESKGKCGFVYTVEALDKDGNLLERERVHNVMPVEVLNYIVSAAFKQGPQFGQWYAGLYQGSYAPTGQEEMATFPSMAQEFTGYEGAGRPAIVFGPVANGRVDNMASPIELTFTQDVEVRGGFVTNGSGKGSTSGLCASVVRFSSPKRPGVGGVLRIYIAQEFYS